MFYCLSLVLLVLLLILTFKQVKFISLILVFVLREEQVIKGTLD